MAVTIIVPFCTIPLARGKSRSDQLVNVIKNAEALAVSQVKEIVLTGVNLGDFGHGPSMGDKTTNFFDLIKALDNVEGIERFRISSIEPNLLTSEIIDFVANSNKFMPHFHIPLQSGSNRILGMMRRRYKRELYGERVAFIKKLMPHCAIGVDVIVGFPGETEEDFKETFDSYTPWKWVAICTFLPIPEQIQTKALEIKPVVPISVRQARNKILRNLSYQKMQFFKQLQEGHTRKVLFERLEKTGMMEKYTTTI